MTPISGPGKEHPDLKLKRITPHCWKFFFPEEAGFEFLQQGGKFRQALKA
jgi:hypothetical protein